MEGLPGSKFPKYRHCLDGEGGSDPYQPNLGNACILYSLADSRDASASKNFMMLNVGGGRALSLCFSGLDRGVSVKSRTFSTIQSYSWDPLRCVFKLLKLGRFVSEQLLLWKAGYQRLRHGERKFFL